MKKTLALLLALIMMLSVALVSCGEDEEPEQTDDGWSVTTPNKGTGNSTDGTNKSTSKSDNYTAANYPVYFHWYLNVRKEAKSSSKKSVGTVNPGESATLIEYNDTWGKVKLASGAEGYVYVDVYTKNENEVKKVDLPEAKKAVISGLGTKEDGTPYTANLRQTPWDCKNVDKYENINLVSGHDSIVSQIKDGLEVTKLGETADKKWAYIQATFTVGGQQVTKTGYFASQYLTVEGETSSTPTPGGDTTDAPSFAW